MNQVLICATNLKYVPKESRKRDKKRRILNSALKEFSKNGFSGSSMECIANRAGVSKPTLYKYFGNKTKLLSAVLNIGTFEILAPLQDRNSNGLVQTLWNFSWSYAKFVLRSDTLSLARLIIGEAERDPSVAQEYQESGPLKALSGIFDYLQIQKNMGMLDFDDIELTAQSLWTLILSAPREFHLHNPNAKVNDELIVKYINHGLKVFIQYYSLNSESDLKELEGLFVNFKNNNLV
jgi:AcrR family transcriptional regulator